MYPRNLEIYNKQESRRKWVELGIFAFNKQICSYDFSEDFVSGMSYSMPTDTDGFMWLLSAIFVVIVGSKRYPGCFPCCLQSWSLGQENSIVQGGYWDGCCCI
ncbi:uncharacterized protein LOC141599610 isoform X1 [Silene latifolia]|uniref:uncharacterized protein LOC141599610 isoform X1 n=1 Tax=Silene latifolia TaxID=37657 RepID=UPI003D7815C5